MEVEYGSTVCPEKALDKPWHTSNIRRHKPETRCFDADVFL